MRSGLYIGSNTTSTSADSTPGMSRTERSTSACRIGPMPQPGAVSVIFTETAQPWDHIDPRLKD